MLYNMEEPWIHSKWIKSITNKHCVSTTGKFIGKQKVKWWLPGVGGGGMELLFTVEMESFNMKMEMDESNGCTNKNILRPQHCTSKNY